MKKFIDDIQEIILDVRRDLLLVKDFEEAELLELDEIDDDIDGYYQGLTDYEEYIA